MQNSQPLPNNETKRLEALRKYKILDSSPEAAYDSITALAATICEVPTAFISFVDKDRQWFKSKVGLDVCETDREVAFCAHTIMRDDVLVIEDAKENELFKDNPLVTGEPFIRFYAGAPIRNSEGMGLGSVCVVDRVPGKLTDVQLTALRDLAGLAMEMLETRQVLDELATVNQELKVLQGLLPICANCKSIRSDDGEWTRLENYVLDHSEATFTHGICSDCRDKLYPGY